MASHFNQAQEAGSWKWPTPDGQVNSAVGAYPGGVPYIFRGSGNNALISLSNSLLHNYSSASSLDLSPRREFIDWRDGKMTTQMTPHSAATQPHYWALCDENPSLQLGVSTTLHPSSLMLIFGTF